MFTNEADYWEAQNDMAPHYIAHGPNSEAASRDCTCESCFPGYAEMEAQYEADWYAEHPETIPVVEPFVIPDQEEEPPF